MTDRTDGIAFTVGETFIVRRLQTPISKNSLLDLGDSMWSQLGGQAEWFWGLPGVFHALASPKAAHPVPAAPTVANSESHSQALGYWGSLHYLLLNRLGWSCPHRGLMRWYDLGKPTDDPTLGLISEVWGRDGYLDVYLAWLLRLQPRFMTGKSYEGPFSSPAIEPLDPKWERWLEVTRRSLDSSPAPHFHLDGGYDSLHLTGHTGEGGQRDPHSFLRIVDAPTHQAVFVSDAMNAWYWDLREKAMSLPETGRSWRIDVFVRPVGYIGKYRLSRVTSLMFSGRHKYHAMGN